MMSSRAAFACSPSTLNFERASVSRTLAQRVLAEVFAHQGSLKGGQRHKLMSDAFKLVAVAKALSGARVMLVLTDPVAADGLQRGWRGVALKALGVEVMTVAIPDDVAEKVRAAQLRQRMTNSKGGP